MKLNKSILAAGAALMLMTSCSDWLDVNNDPNTATDSAAPYDKRLAHIEFYTNHAYYIGGQPIAYMCGDITQNARTNNQGCFAQWTMTEWRSTTVYQWWFVGAACNIQPMIDDAMAHGAYHYAGVGHLLLAYGMTMMNDLHGEMPCYDALGSNVTPVYSSGKEMYRYIMEQIEQGLELLGREQAAGASSLAANDYWGGGDVSKWVKFGNLMKARQILKLTKKGAGTFNLENESFVYDADAILAALDKSYKSNAESMVINHTDQPDGSTDNLGWGEQVYYGPLYSCVGMNSNIYFTKTVEDNLTHFAGATIEDPRANHILPWAKSGITEGVTPDGLTWDETKTWRRTKGLDMLSNVRISGSPYSTSWGVPEGDPNKAPHFYCDSKQNPGDTVYVQQRCGGTGYYGGTDLLIYLDNQKGRGGDASAMSGTFMTRPSSPGPVGTYYEACFIRAEVLFNKGDKAGAYNAYKEGVKAHMEFMKAKIDQWLAEDSKLARCPSFKAMTNEEINNYVNNALGTSADLTIGKIMTQKHIAMMFTQENWNDMRRYDYNPNVFLAWNKPYEYGVSAKTTVPEGQYPRRWKVSSHEYKYNKNNLNAACPTDLCNLVGAKTGDNWWNAPAMWVIPVWWDSNLK